MRIALLLFEMTAMGGEQRQVLMLARGLQELGHEVTVYTYRFNREECYPMLSRDLRIVAIQTGNGVRSAHRSKTLGLVPMASKRYLCESRILASRIAAADVLNPHGRPAHRAAVFHKRKTGCPVVWTCNDLTSWEKPGHRHRMPSALHVLTSFFMKPLERRVVHSINTIVVLDRTVKSYVEAAYDQCALVVRSGVDPQAMQESPEGGKRLRALYGVSDQEFLLLWVGILEPFRRLEDLLESVHLLRLQGLPVRLLAVGRQDTAPDYARMLRRVVSRHRLEPVVRFVPGAIPERELPAFYSACDAFVYCNVDQAWGLSPLEAMACHRPVIVSQGAGVKEVLTDGHTALLVPPRNPEAIATAIRRLMVDPVLRHRLADEGRTFVSRHLTWGKYSLRMEGIFQESLGQ